MNTRILMTCLFALTATGCAFTVHDTEVNYEYAGTTTPISTSTSPQVIVGGIRDTRGVENERMLLHFKNGYGQTTTGGYQAEKELSLLVQDALVQGVEAAGLNEPRDRSVTLSGEILDFDSDTVTGWTKGTINLKGSVKLTATDNASDEVLWRDTFSGNASHETSNAKEGVVVAVKKALDNLVDNLFSDPYFRSSVIR